MNRAHSVEIQSVGGTWLSDLVNRFSPARALNEKGIWQFT